MWKRILTLPFWAILAIVALLVIIVMLIFSSLNPWNPMNYLGQPPVHVDTSRASVIRQVQSLNRLETSSYTMDKIIEAGQNGNAFQNLLYGDKILLVAHGTVVAGVDMSAVQPADVTVNGEDLSLKLPPTQIFSTTLDNSQTKVFDRQLGLLSKGNQNLETQARQAAESSIRQAACDGGILADAAKNAHDRLEQMFKLAGFSSVSVSVSAGKC